MPVSKDPVRRSNGGNWYDSLVGPDGTPTSTTKQIALGGISGWVTGFLAMKVGKAAATAIGGGIILLQIANHQGYIKIDWSRLQRDVENAASKISEETEQRRQDWTSKLEKKIDKMADKAENIANRVETKSKRWYHKITGQEARDLHYFFSSFAVGTVIGIATGG